MSFFVVVMHFAAHTAEFDQLFAFIVAIIWVPRQSGVR